MTLLIGVRGKDGIVLGADQKIMRGGEASYAPKIHPINNVLFATEGLTGLADDFVLLLQQEAALKKGFTSLYEAKTVAEDVVSELTKRYKERLEGDSYMGAILAGLESIESGAAKMYYIHPQGYGETITFPALDQAEIMQLPLRSSSITGKNRLMRMRGELHS